MPLVPATDQTAAVGVTLVQHLVEQELGWIFRRIEHRDTGLDAEVEVVIAGEATGLVLGLQVKSGPSYFAKPSPQGWWYRGDTAHLKYWRDHTLGTMVVLVDVKAHTAYWAKVPADGARVKRTGASWKIEVARTQEVGRSCLVEWMNHAWAQCPRDALYRYCVLHRRFIDVLAEGGELFLEVDDWMNKMRGQASFTLVIQPAEGEESRAEFSFFAGIHDVHEFATRVFPWADIVVDEAFYERNEDVEPEAVFQDDDAPGGYHIVPGERPTGIRPYAIASGEVAQYRFALTLNEVGDAFVAFTQAGERQTKYPPYYLGGLVREEDG